MTMQKKKYGIESGEEERYEHEQFCYIIIKLQESRFTHYITYETRKKNKQRSLSEKESGFGWATQHKKSIKK